PHRNRPCRLIVVWMVEVVSFDAGWVHRRQDALGLRDWVNRQLIPPDLVVTEHVYGAQEPFMAQVKVQAVYDTGGIGIIFVIRAEIIEEEQLSALVRLGPHLLVPIRQDDRHREIKDARLIT